MEFQHVASDVRSGRLKPVYLLHGPDHHQQRVVVEALVSLIPEAARELDMSVVDGEAPLADALALARTYPLLAERRLVIVNQARVWLGQAAYRGRSGASLAEEEELLGSYLEHPAECTVLVFRQAGTVDRRRRIYKQLTQVGVALETAPPSDETAVLTWLRETAQELGGGIRPDAAKLLLQRVPWDLSLLEQEVRKLAAFTGGRPITREAVLEVVAPTTEEAIWDLIAQLGKPASVHLLRKLLEQDENEMGLLGFLAGQFRLMIQAQALAQRGIPARVIASELKQHPFAVQKALERARGFNASGLRDGLRLIWEAELLIKSGRMDPRTALERLLGELAQRVA